MGRTSNNLVIRINQHLPKSLLNKIRMDIDEKEKGKEKINCTVILLLERIKIALKIMTWNCVKSKR